MELAKERRGGGAKFSMEYITPTKISGDVSNGDTLSCPLSHIPKRLFILVEPQEASFQNGGSRHPLWIYWDGESATADGLTNVDDSWSAFGPLETAIYNVSVSENTVNFTGRTNQCRFYVSSSLLYKAVLIG